jgi:hypothetical protein
MSVVASSLNPLFHQRFDMKITEFERGENNEIIAVLEDGSKQILSFDYVAQHRPQVGDEIVVEE